MITLREVENAEWAEVSYEVSISEVPMLLVHLRYVSLFPRQLYVGVELLTPLSLSALKTLKKAAQKAFAGEFLYAYVARTEIKHQRFAKFFGLHETNLTQDDAVIYEGMF